MICRAVKLSVFAALLVITPTSRSVPISDESEESTIPITRTS